MRAQRQREMVDARSVCEGPLLRVSVRLRRQRQQTRLSLHAAPTTVCWWSLLRRGSCLMAYARMTFYHHHQKTMMKQMDDETSASTHPRAVHFKRFKTKSEKTNNWLKKFIGENYIFSWYLSKA